MGIIAAVPILWLVIEIACLKNSVLKASIHTIFLAFGLALIGWKMPAVDVLMSSIEGAIMAIESPEKIV